MLLFQCSISNCTNHSNYQGPTLCSMKLPYHFISATKFFKKSHMCSNELLALSLSHKKREGFVAMNCSRSLSHKERECLLLTLSPTLWGFCKMQERGPHNGEKTSCAQRAGEINEVPSSNSLGFLRNARTGSSQWGKNLVRPESG